MPFFPEDNFQMDNLLRDLAFIVFLCDSLAGQMW